MKLGVHVFAVHESLLESSFNCNKTDSSVSHPLKLFQLRSEWYDELIFVNPNPVLHGSLSHGRPWKSGSYTHETDFKKLEDDTLKSIKSAQDKITELIDEVRTNSRIMRIKYLVFVYSKNYFSNRVSLKRSEIKYEFWS